MPIGYYLHILIIIGWTYISIVQPHQIKTLFLRVKYTKKYNNIIPSFKWTNDMSGDFCLILILIQFF